MNFKYWETETIQNLLILRINRPECLNALNSASLLELYGILMELEKNGSINGVIITGAGEKAFVSGGDIEEIAGLNPKLARELTTKANELMRYIESYPKPIVAAINGLAYGGGCELAMVCHLRIASSNARFALPEAKLGIVTGMGGIQRMVQFIGKGKTYELALTGEPIDAVEAERLGLVNIVVDPDELMSTSIDLLTRVTASSGISIRAIIKSINAYYYSHDGLEVEMKEFEKCFGEKDFKEGVAAFKEKRAPKF